jgi:hypothetical protein
MAPNTALQRFIAPLYSLAQSGPKLCVLSFDPATMFDSLCGEGVIGMLHGAPWGIEAGSKLASPPSVEPPRTFQVPRHVYLDNLRRFRLNSAGLPPNA